MAQTDDDLKPRAPSLHERSEVEKQAYIEGYYAALRDVERHLERSRAAIGIAACALTERLVNL